MVGTVVTALTLPTLALAQTTSSTQSARPAGQSTPPASSGQSPRPATGQSTPTTTSGQSARPVTSGQSTQTASSGQSAQGGSSLGSVTLSKKVMADGQALAPGTYQVRLTSDTPKPGVGQSPEGERYVEFLKGGKVVGREVATVISNADIGTIVKSKKPAAGSSSVEMLKGNDYIRVWINRGGTHYIINMPPA